eukprot:TRINITY_DN545_c0_g1_i2.p3 TRINITY_DN545_c0_g1~~TRINITY_DN545_c0_g1_i2.p3  ORF type:complete len:247 (+),score=39.92 TRINITY_DN545_c0_g1_i2:2753-3493(+)
MLGKVLPNAMLHVKGHLFRPLAVLNKQTIALKLSRKLENAAIVHKSVLKPPTTSVKLLAAHGFTLHDPIGSINVKLIKRARELDIEVLFQYAEPYLVPEGKVHDILAKELKQVVSMGSMQALLDSREEQEKTQFEFAVILKDKEEEKALIIDCNSVDGEMEVKRVTIQSQEYTGSKFTGQKIALKEAFKEYLEYLGIKEEVVKCIEEIALDKRKRLDIKWMEDMKKRITIRQGILREESSKRKSIQ